LSDEVVFSDVFPEGLQSACVVENFFLNEKRHSGEAANSEEVAHQIHPRLLTPEVRHLQNAGKSLTQADKWQLMDERRFVVEVADHVQESLGQHSESRVAHHNHVKTSSLISRHTVVHLRVDSHIFATNK